MNLKELRKTLHVNIAQPKTDNRYLPHLWSHFILPFKTTDVLFSPIGVAPFFVPKNKKLIITIHDLAFLSYKESFSSYCFNCKTF